MNGWTNKRTADGLLISLLTFVLVEASFASPVLQTLYKFFPTNSAPQFPFGRLAEGSDGSFYGTTLIGGSQNVGTAFKITPFGNFAVLCSFVATNGAIPKGGLVLGRDGNLYGTAEQGGIDTSGALSDKGTIFRISTNGVLTRLLSFNGTNGVGPVGALVELDDGCFYGITQNGGSYGYGTVFKVTTNGVLTTLASFDRTNGAVPFGGLALGKNGDLYGTTSFGGTNNHDGTVFRITTNGILTTLACFDGTNGRVLDSRLTLGHDGIFYGVTHFGGISHWGTVFKMTPDGTLTTLASFTSTNGNGSFPFFGLTQGQDGNFYGTTTFTGGETDFTNSDYGTIFRITTNGQLTTLVYFNGLNGKNPAIDFTLGSDGNLYGAVGEYQVLSSLDGSAGSIIRLVEPPVLTAISHTNDTTTLTWTSFTNAVYQVEHKSSLTENWMVSAANVTATNNAASFTDISAAAAARYYQVRLLP